MKEALNYIRRAMPFWNASGGKDHIWMMLHDEGPCFCPREIRSSILLTHYGYWSKNPRPWGTYYDDNFMQDPKFYARHIGDPKKPTACFDRERDIVIPPWKTPSFWWSAFDSVRGEKALAKPKTGVLAAVIKPCRRRRQRQLSNPYRRQRWLSNPYRRQRRLSNLYRRQPHSTPAALEALHRRLTRVGCPPHR